MKTLRYLLIPAKVIKTYIKDGLLKELLYWFDNDRRLC